MNETTDPSTPRERRLQGKVIWYWTIADLLGASVLVSLLWYVARPALAENWDGWNDTYGALLLGLCALLFAAAVILPPLQWWRWRYGLNHDLLLLRYGLVFLEERAVPVQRMQHVDLLRGPIERLFGLATLVVFTAGNEGSAFRVPGLSLAQATELRERIVQLRGDGQL